jgi:starvation-inducible DNA-binding protein
MNDVVNIEPGIDKSRTGPEDDSQQRLSDGVAGVLSDTYLLLVKTHGYHWNVVGLLFVSLHTLTEEQYTDMFAAADELAERIRALGYTAPGSIREMVLVSEIAEEQAKPSAEDMVQNLVDDHKTIARRSRETVAIAEQIGDTVTADMLTQRMTFHEKAIWMLRAILGQ